MTYAMNQVVEQMGKIAIEGNIIPNEWYRHLRNDKGKIQTNAALILADVVYWYRPVPIYDIKTGELNGYGKKFKDDLLQLGYRYFNTKFGFSESQIRSALIFLEEKGFIFREFRNTIIGDQILNNVMHIGIYPEKISQITKSSNDSFVPSITENSHSPSLQVEGYSQTFKSTPIEKAKEKDWSTKFTNEEKIFLDYLLNLKPEVGDPIERNHATWWIKSFGIEKIKIALEVYWQRVEKAKQDPTVPMPQHIGKYIRKALNDGTLPMKFSSTQEKFNQKNQPSSLPYSEKLNQEVKKTELGPQKNETTNTQISMTSLSLNEVNDERSVTFQKEKLREIQQRQPAEGNSEKTINSFISQNNNDKTLKKFNKESDWKETLTSEEKKFLTYLLHLQPEKGEAIEEKHATWWIKHFGIDKIKIALQVYWQQVEKARKGSKVPMPVSMGAYVREALNKGIQPCREQDRRNKAFAEYFKKQVGWSELTITEKYCRVEEWGKDWFYCLPEAIFAESLKSTFQNYYSYTEHQCSVA